MRSRGGRREATDHVVGARVGAAALVLLSALLLGGEASSGAPATPALTDDAVSAALTAASTAATRGCGPSPPPVRRYLPPHQQVTRLRDPTTADEEI